MPEDRPHSRFAADVDYSGRAGHHDYVVRARHRLLDTSVTVVIDGVEHDPKAEEKAQKTQEAQGAAPETERSDEADGESRDDGADVDEPGAGDRAVPEAQAEDDLRFTLEEGLTTLRCTVRRPREEGGHKDAEVITIRTAGLGGAGEVEIRHGFRTTVLAPEEGSPSAARDAKRTAHPTRYALLAAVTRSLRFLVPLLGLGALLSGLLDPVKEWIEARVRPVAEAIGRAIAPLREWLAELLQPVRDLLAWLLRPVQEALEWLLRPVRELLAWLVGLLPDIALPVDVPGWVVDVAIAVIVVVAVFAATHRGLRERRRKLGEARTGRDDEGEGAHRADGTGDDTARSAADGTDSGRPVAPEHGSTRESDSVGTPR